jgi:hypothetical protein
VEASLSMDPQQNFAFQIHRSRMTDEIHKKLVSWMRVDFDYDGEDNKVLLTYKDTLQKQKPLPCAMKIEDLFKDQNQVQV